MPRRSILAMRWPFLNVEDNSVAFDIPAIRAAQTRLHALRGGKVSDTPGLALVPDDTPDTRTDDE